MWKKQYCLVYLVGLTYLANLAGCASNSSGLTSPAPTVQIPAQQAPTSRVTILTPEGLETGKNETAKIGTDMEPDFSVDQLVALVKQDLSRQISVDDEKIKVVRIDSVDWPDTSLGCPHPGEDYSDIITPGFLIFIRAQGQLYRYHSDENGLFVWCNKAELPVDPIPVMPVAPRGEPPKCQWTPCP